MVGSLARLLVMSDLEAAGDLGSRVKLDLFPRGVWSIKRFLCVSLLCREDFFMVDPNGGLERNY